MKLAMLLAVLVLVPISVEAKRTRDTIPVQCEQIRARSYGFVKCSYRPDAQQWRLLYLPGSYSQVVASGQYPEMLQNLCNTQGTSIYEKAIELGRGWSRTLSCELKFEDQMPKSKS